MDVRAVPRISGALLLTPTPHVDERGFLCRTFDTCAMRTAGIDPAAFIQDSLSRSARGVVRGMHVRRGEGEAKLVRCSYGAIFDVIVDHRAAPHHGDTPDQGKPVTPGSATPYTTSVDVNKSIFDPHIARGQRGGAKYMKLNVFFILIPPDLAHLSQGDHRPARRR